MNNIYILSLLLIILFTACSKEDNGNQLAVNESIEISVNSQLRWNMANIEVAQGQTYSFSSAGTWTDLTTQTDANGYYSATLAQFEYLKRDTNALWFELVAAIDTNYLYVVGKDTTLTFTNNGQLSFFANDAEGFYGNNTGSIITTVTRIN